MTDYQKYINALRKCAKEHDNDRTSMGHVIVSNLCRDTANLLEELEQEPCDVFDEYGNYKYPSDVELTEPNTATSMPCPDAISRQAVLDIVNNPLNIRLDEIIEKLPPVNPQPKTGHWIPVSERLPEDAQEVLYSTKTGRVFHGEYYDDKTDRKWFSYKDDIFSFNNVVTAWMPLPKPYEPQESEEIDGISD